MEAWLTRALAQFPEFQEEIEKNQNGPSGVWDCLYWALVNAYEHKPFDDGLIGRIYDYAHWCFQQPQTGDAPTDLSSATAVGLMESLPLNQAIAEDLYRWLSMETFEGCHQLFRYHLSEEEYRKLHANFLAKKQHFSGPSRL